MGAGQPGDRARPGMVPPRCAVPAGEREAFRDRRGDRPARRRRVGHQAWKVDAACFDMAGAGRGAWRRGSAGGQRGDTVSILSLVALPIIVIVWRILPET